MVKKSSKTKNVKSVSKESLNLTEENLERLKSIFPEVFSEGKIDFDKLKILLGSEIGENVEKYNFTWAGRGNAFKNIQTTAKGTLVPIEKESVDFDKTENLFIEGDNLEVLKLLQKSYESKVKMIYIDPPYNTGKDFVYKDNFKDSIGNYRRLTGQVDEEGNKTDTNKETNGRFHSDWLTMMYPRLYLAKNLLKEDGVIFVSIDDHEVHNLRKILDDIFGEENFVCSLVQKARGGISNDKIISVNHNYVLMYAKEYLKVHENRLNFGILRRNEDFRNYKKDDNDGKGPYVLNPVTGPGGARKGNPYYEVLGVKNYWRYGKETMNKLIQKGKIIKLNNSLYQKTYKKDLEGIKKGASTWLDDVGTTSEGTNEIKKLFENAIFDFPKPTKLVKFLMSFIDMKKEDIVLDFFAGSGTTAHAVLDLNKEDGENRKFICVQLPEKTDEKSEAYKAGYKTISDIAKERIRRVIKKIKEEDKEKAKNVDLGFKIFKLTKSNYKIWENYDGKDAKELLKQMELFKSPLIPGYKKINLIYEILIKEGYDLNSKVEEVKGIKTNKVFKVGNGEKFFYICLDDKIKEQTIKELKLGKDIMFVCLDESLTDNQKINLNLKINLRGI